MLRQLIQYGGNAAAHFLRFFGAQCGAFVVGKKLSILHIVYNLIKEQLQQTGAAVNGRCAAVGGGFPGMLGAAALCLLLFLRIEYLNHFAL